MYNHGFAALAGEAYGQVNDRRLGPALKKATELILNAQKRSAWWVALFTGEHYVDTTKKAHSWL